MSVWRLITWLFRNDGPKGHRSRCQCRRCQRAPGHQGDQPQGQHEACALTDTELSWFDFFTHRYPSLGKKVTR